MDLSALNNSGVMLFMAGRSAEGLTYIDKALSIEPNYPYALASAIANLTDLHRIGEAWTALNRLEKMVPDRFPESGMLSMRAIVHLERGDAREASAALADMRKALANTQTPPLLVKEFAETVTPLLARQSRYDEAFAFLAGMLARGSVPNYEWLALNPNLAPLRSDPRFKEIASRSRAQFDKVIDILNQAQAQGELPKYLEKPLADLAARLPR